MGWDWGWKNLILCGFTKNPVNRAGGGLGHEKLICRKELSKKGRAWTVCRFNGGGAW